MTPAGVEHLLSRIDAGERLPLTDVEQLSSTHDILSLGMLADQVRRRQHGGKVTFVRVVRWLGDAPPEEPAIAAAREVRLLGNPVSLKAAVADVSAARQAAGSRWVSGFSTDVIRSLATKDGIRFGGALDELRAAGLDSVAEVPLDDLDTLAEDVERLSTAGYGAIRLGMRAMPLEARVAAFARAGELQDQVGSIRVLAPLPALSRGARTTGYEDVKMVAVARLAAPTIPTIQVDWGQHGPKLAQVALTFGADDLDAVSASDEAPDGRRRSPLEEVRRNVEAAGFSPAERDGRFVEIA